MEQKPSIIVHIEFFQAKECPYCPTVRKILLDELFNSELGKFLLIEEIDINTPIGRERSKKYQLKGVPSLAINGKLKFAGIPHPVLLKNEVKRLVTGETPKPKRPKQKFFKPSELPKNDEGELPFYT